MTRLDEIRAREQAATLGAWSVDEFDNSVRCDTYRDCVGDPITIAEQVYLTEDREFIAAAREDIPWLLAAVDAVLELHSPFEWSFGFGPVRSCRECAKNGASENEAQYPCPTVRAITETMEVR